LLVLIVVVVLLVVVLGRRRKAAEAPAPAPAAAPPPATAPVAPAAAGAGKGPVAAPALLETRGVFGTGTAWARVPDTSQFPYCAVGRLRMPHPSGRAAICTATLVAPKLVITAAHCVYNPRTRTYQPPEALMFTPGLNAPGTDADHARGNFSVAHVFVPETFRELEVAEGESSPEAYRMYADAPREDWALLTLTAAADAGCGVVGVALAQEGEVEVLGYATGAPRLGREQWSDRCALQLAPSGASEDVAGFDCDALPGSSGGPALRGAGAAAVVTCMTSSGSSGDGGAAGTNYCAKVTRGVKAAVRAFRVALA
jgi:protease YdgD